MVARDKTPKPKLRIDRKDQRRRLFDDGAMVQIMV
jgi:hypothetical protein